MSYEIVKGISIKGDKVYLRSCSNNVYPKDFSSWECVSLSQILREEGKAELYKSIGRSVWDGDMQLRKGSKLCDLFLLAQSKLPEELNFTNMCSQAVGEYLSKAVLKLEQSKEADLFQEVEHLLVLRNDRNYIIEGARGYGYNYLNYADEDIQKDRDFALEVVKASGGAAWFEYPQMYQNDKEFAMEALRSNGCFYRKLSRKLQADQDIILTAFDNSIDRRYVEHLPNLIPTEAFYYGEDATTQPLDKEFMFELMEKSPKMHMSRAPWLLADYDCAIKWYEASQFKNEAMNLIVLTQKEEDIESEWFQKELLATCKDEMDKEILMDMLEEHQITIQECVFEKDSLKSLIEKAESKRDEVNIDKDTKKILDDIER